MADGFITNTEQGHKRQPSRLKTWWIRYEWILLPIVLVLVTRSVLLFGAYVGDRTLPEAYSPWENAPNDGFLDGWTRADGMWYLQTATEGYSLESKTDIDTQANPVFFPVYPILIRAMMFLTFGNAIVAGVLVSHLSLMAALVFVFLLAEHEFKQKSTARRAVFYVSLVPIGFIYSAIYTESTFLLVSVATFYFARKRQWWWAGLFGAIASATRVVGVLLAVSVGLEWLRANGLPMKAMHKRESWVTMFGNIRRHGINIIPILLIPSGLLAYIAYLGYRFGEPLIFLRLQIEGWDRVTRGVFKVIYEEFSFFIPFIIREHLGPDSLRWLIGVIALIFILIMTVFVWRRLGASYGIYMLLIIVVPLSSSFWSIARYLLIQFPAYMLVAHWAEDETVDRLIIASGALLIGCFATVYVNWGFIA